MPNYSKFILASVLVLSAVVGWKTYRYFSDTTPPNVQISGIEHEEYYAGDAQCIVSMSDTYKIAHVSVFLDNKPLVSHFKINSKNAEQVFTIPTTALSNGKHTLKVIVADSSYNKNTTIESVAFIVDNLSLQAALVKPDTDIKVFQGKTAHIQFQVNKPIEQAVVKTLSYTIRCVPESPDSLIYECFIPVLCEEVPNEYLASIEVIDRVGNTVTLDTKFQVVSFPFKKQNLTLDSNTVKQANEIGKPERELEEALARIAKESPCIKRWHGTFYSPIEIKGISTPFGTLRTSQHRGKYAHNALDLIGTPRSTIWATQDGIIVIKDYYAHSGNTIVIDHGCGIVSMFYHLDSLAPVVIGDAIKKGSPIGTLGKTGYASGYHLHWEMRINNIPVDPLQWVKNDF